MPTKKYSHGKESLSSLNEGVNVEQLLLTAPSVTTLVTALMHGQAVFKTLIVQAYAIIPREAEGYSVELFGLSVRLSQKVCTHISS